MKSPFKFLDAYTKEDRDIFFGREKEIEELYHRVFDSRIMLVYGESGTGKSSLVQCGLANKFRDTDWLPLMVRRGENMPESIARAVKTAAITPLEYELLTTAMFKKAIRSLYIDYYKPIFFIFDQFEELFIFGTKEEKQSLVHLIHALTESDIECRFIFIMREEYFASVTEFEKFIPGFLSNRVRIEKMPLANAVKAINGPCRVYDIEVEEGFAEKLLKKLNPDTPNVELTWLQVFLDKIFNLAVSEAEKEKDKPVSLSFTNSLLEKTGDVSDLLGSFLDDQIAMMSDQEAALSVLKSFVSVKGTKRQLNAEEAKENAHTLGKAIDEPALMEMIQTFVHLRILRDKDQYGKYELRHDSLAKKIFEKFTIIEKELIEIRQFIDIEWNSWQRRKVLISADDLDYIAPYESRLHLSEEISELIERSKKELIRKRHLRRNLVGIFGIALILVLSAFSLWALRERNRAQDQKTKALAEKYNFLATNVAVDDPTKGLQLAEYAFSLDTINQTIKSNIQRIYYDNVLYSVIAAQHDKSVYAAVYAVAFSPDGREVLTGSTDGTVRLSDLKGNLIRNFIGPSDKNGMPAAVAFSPDGQTILTSTNYQNARLWDKQGNVIVDFKGHTSYIWSAVFSPDGKSILTGSGDNTARLWDLHGNTIHIFKGHSLAVTSVTFSPNGNFILTGSRDRTAILWDLMGNIIRVFKCPIQLTSVAISPDGQNILTSGAISEASNSIILWDIKGNIVHTFLGFDRVVYSGSFSPDGRRILVGSPGGSVTIWDLKGNEIQTLKGEMVNPAVFSPDGSKILTGSYNGTASIYEFQDNLVSEIKPVGLTHNIAYSPDGKNFLTASGDNTACLRDLQGSIIKVFKGHSRVIIDLKFSPDGLNILTGSADSTARLWNLQGNELMVFKGHTGLIGSVAFSPDGQTIATGSGDMTARIWDLKGNTIHVFKGHIGGIYSVAFSSDGKKILTGASDATARLWDLQGNQIRIFKGNRGTILSVAFSPNGLNIITGSYGDDTAIIWDLQGNKIRILKLPDGVWSVAWSPDGTKILTGSNDMVVRLWDILGNIIQIFTDSKGVRQRVAFSPDGQKILYCSARREFLLHSIKMPYQEYKKINNTVLGAGDKIKYGIYSFSDVIRSGNETELADAAEYYAYEVSLAGKNEELKFLDYAIKLNNRLVKEHPDKIIYLLEMLKAYFNHFKSDSLDETAEEIEKINQKVLSLTSVDDLIFAAYTYKQLSSSTDSLNIQLGIPDCFFRICDKIINSPSIQKERKEDIAKWCYDLSFYLILRREFISALKSSQLAQAASKEYEIQYPYLALTYLLNDQYNNAEKIYLEWQDKSYPITTSYATFRDRFLADILRLENIGITHPDFAKAKELLKKK